MIIFRLIGPNEGSFVKEILTLKANYKVTMNIGIYICLIILTVPVSNFNDKNIFLNQHGYFTLFKLP